MLFNEGVAAVESGDFPAACAKFSQSLGLVRRASTLLNLAVCEREQGMLASALKRYEAGIALLPPGDERLAAAARDMEALSQRIPRLTVKLAPGTPSTARVLIDGAEVAGSALEMMPIDAGEHQLSLTVPGHQSSSVRMQIKEGDRQSATLHPGAALEAAGGDAQASEQDSSLATAGYVIGAVGVAGAVAAIVTGAMVLSNDGLIADECPNRACTPSGLDTIEQNETLIVLNYVTWGVAIAGIGAGAVLVLKQANGALPAHG